MGLMPTELIRLPRFCNSAFLLMCLAFYWRFGITKNFAFNSRQQFGLALLA